MANLRSASIREALNIGEDINRKRVAEATNTLLQAINKIDYLVAPKQFKLTGAYLRRFEVEEKGFANHAVRIIGDSPIDEISEWQIIGTVGDRIVNVIAQGIFHTHKENRSGNHEFTFNGKPNYRPECGGTTIDDIWQESGIYKNYDKANATSIVQQNRQGKVTKRFY